MQVKVSKIHDMFQVDVIKIAHSFTINGIFFYFNSDTCFILL